MDILGDEDARKPRNSPEIFVYLMQQHCFDELIFKSLAAPGKTL
jgi:hypothetical protein